MAKKQAQTYQIKITLQGSKPPIWRRLLVMSDISLAHLHTIIQVAMGWYDAHLHHFIVGQNYYSTPLEFDIDDGLEAIDERRVTLQQIVTGEGFRFQYEYDFGDGWMHLIVVEKILPSLADLDAPLPVCIKGKRACPPEDIGGIWGYAAFLEAIKDPKHPEHADMVAWIGEDAFDAEEFDLEMVNKRLKFLK